MAGESDAEKRTAVRRDVLLRAGARGSVLDELLRANAPSLAENGERFAQRFPLPEEPHVEVWRQYLADATRDVVVAALVGRLVQLSFPIQEGISRSEEYRAATRRGAPMPVTLGLALSAPDEIVLELHPFLAGTAPVLTIARREDFVALVRAFSARNEPVVVPDSMGACIVSGLVNWDRVRRYRQAWKQRWPHAGDEHWQREFAALAARKETHQDRLILLSRGPYSGLSAAAAGVPVREWEARSLILRRAHEGAHYLTLRVFGRLQNNLLEELVADFAGLVETFGAYREDWARAFLGIEALSDLRPEGRLAVYRGTPPLSDEALAVQARLASGAVASLARVAAAAGSDLASPQHLGALICSLVRLSLEELTLLDEKSLLAAITQG